MNAPNPATLTLPDVLTELDLMPQMPDVSLLLSQPAGTAPAFDVDRTRVGRNEDITLMDMSSQLLPDSIEQGRDGPGEPSMLDDLDLDIDIGENPVGGVGDGTSIEVGREAPAARAVEDDLFSEFDLQKGLDADDDDRLLAEDPSHAFDGGAGRFDFGGDDDDMGLGGDAMNLDMDEPFDAAAAFLAPTPGPRRDERDSESPLSSVDSVEGRLLDRQQNHLLDESASFVPAPEEESSVHHPLRVKKRKIIPLDAETALRSGQIKEQQEDRSNILKPASYLPRDPMMLTLEAMQRNGGFVSSVFGEDRAKGWAPELRDLMSLDAIRRSGELKRKRDSGIADMGVGEDGHSPDAGKLSRLALGTDEGALPEGGAVGETSLGAADDIIDLPADEGMRPAIDDDSGMADPRLMDDDDDDGHDAMSPVNGNFDDTAAPLLHPADSGPVSLGTKHAVHLLRDRFGAGATDSPLQQKKSNVLFQDLLPERSTTKADATKMFFEVLVLATKDAVKVEQAEGALGGPIRVRGKRGLWGAWAEEEAGGEIEEQNNPPIASAAAVAVAVAVEA